MRWLLAAVSIVMPYKLRWKISFILELCMSLIERPIVKIPNDSHTVTAIIKNHHAQILSNNARIKRHTYL